MTRLWGVVLPLVVCACVWPGGQGAQLEPVDDAEVVAFAERISAFYERLENKRLDSLLTFEDPQLRSFFRGDREFSDYYASLAAQVREASFRNARTDRVVVREFRFEGDSVAYVDLMLVGKHLRALRPWEIQIERTDVWRRVGGIWTLSPDKL